MKRILIVLLLVPFLSIGQNFRLSEQAEISVITCGPFQGELYSAFGHSAFRVHDPQHGYDAAYNYGVFNFNQPNFYLNFARGYLYYQLGLYDYQSFEDHYVSQDRYVHEQVLNLSVEQKQKLFDYLQWNSLPQNRHYRYDYFYNNCATKMRDVVEHVLGEEIRFDGSYVTTSYTIRELTDIYLKEQPWGDLGIDICLGLPMDKQATPYEYMFLPDYVESGFDHAFIRRNGEEVPAVKSKNIIFDSREQVAKRRIYTPLIVFSAIFLVALFFTFRDLRQSRLTKWFDILLFGVTGAIGMLLFFLWFFTDHQAAANNLNIIWALPLHLAAVIAFLNNPRWLKFYFGATTVLSLALLVVWFALPQNLHYALIPVVMSQGVRAFTEYKLR
jgi:hypothetical protein